MKKYLGLALAMAIASTMSFAQTPVYNTGTKTAFSSAKLTEVKHRRKRKKHRKHRTTTAVNVSATTSIA